MNTQVNQQKTINDVPQVTWKKVETLLGVLSTKSLTKEEASKELGDVTEREVTYVVQALRFLGWTDGVRRALDWPLTLNAAGKQAATDSIKRNNDAWDLISNWGPIDNIINQNDDGAIQDLIAEGLGKTTALRRLTSAKNWLKELDPNKGTSGAVITVQRNVANLAAAQQRYEEDVDLVTAKLPTLAKQIFENRMSIEDIPEGVDVKVISKARKHHGKFVRALRKAWDGACAVSGNKALVYASHIKPWAASTGVEKTNPENGLLLDERWDRLFDTGLVSFDDFGTVMLSKKVPRKEWINRGITGMEKIRNVLSQGTKDFLEYHRTNVFKTV